MRLEKRCLVTIRLFLLAVSMTATHVAAQGGNAKEKVLFSFHASGDLIGTSPNGILITDGAGNFYGVNTYGAYGSGAVYEISPTADGGWTAKSIYAFPMSSYYPNSLVMDSSGNLYGTLYSGGTEICTDGFGFYSCGAVYELSPDGSGGWTEKNIWNASQKEGWRPYHLVMGPDGNLYGTTYWSGEGEGGIVFKLQRTGEQWTHSALYGFGQPGSEDGALPDSLVFDKAGNLYGTNYGGGEGGGGTFFELKKTNSGWREMTLLDFNSSGSGISGGYGVNGVIPDSTGNLYGTTDGGGAHSGTGVVFQLSPTSSGAWQETVLHTFFNEWPNESGANPLLVSSAGDLYGATHNGGPEGYGNVFRLKQSANGTWSYVVLHNFQSEPTDGKYPDGLLVDSKGNLYGTTFNGGTEGVGTVFEIKP